MLASGLEPGGRVRIATDHAAYFEEILQVMQGGGFVHDTDAPWPQDPVSSFEAKYRVQGRAIHRAVLRPAG